MSERYLLRVEKLAVKALDALPQKVFKQVVLKLFALQGNPKPQDCKKLKGYPSGYRLDQGEYRTLYTLEEKEVRIFRIGKRNDDEVYRNL